MANTITVTLQVTDQITGNPISGARVFYNGSANFDPTQFSVTTNSSGSAVFQIPMTLTAGLLQITADGYNAGSQAVTTNSQVPQSYQIQLVSTAPSSANVTLTFVPAVAGIQWTGTSGSNTISGVSNPDGTSSTVSPTPFGTYNFTATLAGYQDLNQTVQVGPQTAFTFTLVENPDQNTVQTGSSSPDSSISGSQPASYVSQVSTEPPDQSEYIYPNTDYDKYFTTIAARIYIGNLFIDECNTIQYALQDNAVPIYGYASRYVDAYGQGRSLVQGQLTLNFVTEGYLYTVLQEYKNYIANNQQVLNATDPSIDVVARVLGMMASRDKLQQQLNNTFDSNTADSYQAQIDNLQTQIDQTTAGMDPDEVQSLNNERTRQLTTFDDVIGFDNAVYQDVLFDLRIELGNEVTGVKRVRYLEKCKLISNEQVMDQSGQVILDSYGFIARRLR